MHPCALGLAGADVELAVQAARAFVHDGQAVVFALVDGAAKATAVVLDAQAHGLALLAQLQPGVLRMGVAQAVGQGLAGDLQQVDLFAGRQLEGEGVDVQVDLEFAAPGELFGGFR